MEKTKLSIIILCFMIVGVCFATPPNVKIDKEALKAVTQIEDAFANVVNSAKPAVVVITNKQIAPQQQQQVPEEFFQFFGIPRQYQQRDTPQKPVPVGKGSGVLISDKGYLVTNFHVIKDNKYLEIKMADGTTYDNERNKDEVQIIGIDEETDLAILKISNKSKKEFPYLEFADSDKLRVGQWAIAIGAPFNFDSSVTIGCVSQKGRYDTGMSTFENYIQTDASINPGNSGGPLLDIYGQIIGINQFIYTGGMSKGSIGLGFAIGSNIVHQVSDAIIKDGAVIRPFIGIAMQEITDELKQQFQVDYGVLVSQVLEGEAAEKAGVKNGDIIQEIGDQKISSNHDLLLAVTKYLPGDKIKLGLIRDGKKISIQVIAGRREKENTFASAHQYGSKGKYDSKLNKLGLRLKVQDDAVTVVQIDPNGAVAQANNDDNPQSNIQPNDILLEVNRQAVHSVTEVMEALKKTRNNTVMFYIERQTQQGSYRFFIPISLKESK
ncbi:MAG: trypsin-like peptidase domain-containing protein [Lentisphaeria bacterium]